VGQSESCSGCEGHYKYTPALTFMVPTFVGSVYSQLIICEMLLHQREIALLIRGFSVIFFVLFFLHNLP